MTRFLAIAAVVGVVLTAPAWAQTMTPKTNSTANYSSKPAASTNASDAKMASRHHRFVAGDDSAETLNRQVLQNLQQGS